jgi:hypothetical protein
LDVKDVRQPFDTQAFGRLVSEQLAESDKRIHRIVQRMLDQATGKVT